MQPGYEFTDDGPRPRTDPEAQRMRNAAPTYTAEHVLAILDQVNPRGHCSVVFELEEGESAWNPASTKDRHVWGPCKITYVRHRDGGIDARVE